MPRKTHQYLILAACISSAFAAIIGMVSLATEEWVLADCAFVGGNVQDSYVNYGLFSGTFNRYLVRRDYYQITMTCNTDEQACAMLCSSEPEGRDAQLQALLNNIDIDFEASCPRIQRNVRLADLPGPINRSPRASKDRTYIDYGLYVTTVTFLALSIVLGVAASGLSVWNTIGNPIYSIFNIMGIMALNGAAVGCVTLTMVLWGAQYNITLIENVGVLDTITNAMETLKPALGYSYWINLSSILLYAGSIAIIVVRKILIDREPQTTNMEMIKSDDRTIVLF